MCESNNPAIRRIEVAAAFQAAAMTTLLELTQIEAHPESTPLALEQHASEEVVMATIQLLRHVPGTMTLILTSKAATHLASNYLPKGTQLTEELIDDVAGEFANVITGQAKTILKKTSYHFSMSTPTVSRGARPTQVPLVADASYVTLQTSELGQVLLIVVLPPCQDS